jgi:hypothetical protein
MQADGYTKTVLTAIALFLAAIACRPILSPKPAFAGVTSSDLFIEPGVHSLRSPDGTKQLLGKVVIDLRNGKVWGFPTQAAVPYPIEVTHSDPPTSEPFLLGRFDLDAIQK